MISDGAQIAAFVLIVAGGLVMTLRPQRRSWGIAALLCFVVAFVLLLTSVATD